MERNEHRKILVLDKRPKTPGTFEQFQLSLGIVQNRPMILFRQGNQCIERPLLSTGEIIKGVAPTKTPKQEAVTCQFLNDLLI